MCAKTCVPSIPAQLKVLYGKTLMLFHPIYNQPIDSKISRSRTHLLGKEIIQSRQPQDLGQLTRISKRIRQPSLSAILSKSRLEIPLSVKVLPDQTLSRGNHTIVLEPCSADIVEPTRLDVLLDSGETFRVELFEPEILLCGGGGELVIWPSVH